MTPKPRTTETGKTPAAVKQTTTGKRKERKSKSVSPRVAGEKTWDELDQEASKAIAQDEQRQNFLNDVEVSLSRFPLLTVADRC